jgi:hypothetical protein
MVHLASTASPTLKPEMFAFGLNPEMGFIESLKNDSFTPLGFPVGRLVEHPLIR